MGSGDNIYKFIKNRPKVIAAYGYGSGIFKQIGYTKEDKPLIDLIFVVDNNKKWHLENMENNPSDYSYLGKKYFMNAKNETINKQNGIAYLCNIKEDGYSYKYGTIEYDTLIKYLTTWESFYLPGRFQKTVLPIIEDENLSLKIEENRKNALYISLIKSIGKQDIKLIDIYTEICGLSYLGDTRMKFAENPHKVANIVNGSFEEFKKIYGTSNKYFETNESNFVRIYDNELLNNNNILKIPDSLLNYLYCNIGLYKDIVINILGNSNSLTQDDLEYLRNKINEYFIQLNKKESIIQTIKSFESNGIINSIDYASKKVLKKLKK